MQKTSKLLVKLSQQLFAKNEARENFINALLQPQTYPNSILWCRPKPRNLPFVTESALSWQPEFIDRLDPTLKPGKFALHDRGFYYCLDFSSVFAASVLLAISQPVNLVLDVCASPGGKSIFAWRSLQPKLLLSNEVIGKRIGMLFANLKRCQIHPCIILSLDSKMLAELIPKSMELVIVDAPCSGQSLIAKGIKAPGCFHPVRIKKNANRQKRILANSAKLVGYKGYLAYMTCTYSPQENEGVIDWFLRKFPAFKPIFMPHLVDYQSHLTSLPAYRLFPHFGLGAGAFTCLLQNTEEGETNTLLANFVAQYGIKKI
jgi:16S rRNA C967 or C1407 C5-methylase (RsmB/RsmF family)